MNGRILILIHEHDPYPDGLSYFIWGLRDAWLKMGLDVRVARGPGELEPADLVIPHIDLTITPSEYRQVLDALPNVLNRGVYDISKRRVSPLLLQRGDSYDGPVMVKTNLNSGGIPEAVLRTAGSSRFVRFATDMRVRLERRMPLLRGTRIVAGNGYRTFPSLASLPDRVFDDPRLVVERFVPEMEGEAYCVRYYSFLGDRYRSMRIRGDHPVLKASRNLTAEVGVPVPPEVVAFRERWNLDFGKIDYVIHDGVPIVLDVNRTPAPPPQRRARTYPFAPGIIPLLARARGEESAWVHTHVDDDA